MQLEFAKMNGLGNDFVVIEDLDETLDIAPEAVQWFCDRHFGIGGDGLILVRRATRPDADFYMHYSNADGSLAEMCGNGARCFAKYIVDHGLLPAHADSLIIETLGGLRPVTFKRGADGTMESATVDMGSPVFAPDLIPADFDGPEVRGVTLATSAGEFLVSALSMGNPHAVIWVDDVDQAPLETIGPLIEVHDRFPNHTNVEFAQVVDRALIRMRVWERGVGETLACGTGACAVAVAAAREGLTERECSVELPGGELAILWAPDGHVYMTGSAAISFTGVVDLPDVD